MLEREAKPPELPDFWPGQNHGYWNLVVGKKVAETQGPIA